MANPQGRKLDRVRLSAPERRELQAIVDGTGAAWRRRRAQILRMADEGRDGGKLRDVDIARGLGIGASTVERLRKRCVLEGLEAALRRREQENRRPKLLDGAKEAKLVALACSSPPEGCVRWTLKLLAGRRMEMEIVESISKETVRKTLKKGDQALAEAVLVHAPEPQRAVRGGDGGGAGHIPAGCCRRREVWVGMDETSRQQTKETRLPCPVRPGQPEIVDYEYERNGTANLFLAFAPNENGRTVKVTDRRTARDGAQFIRELADDHFPGKKIVRVMDHRNTHSPASLYESLYGNYGAVPILAARAKYRRRRDRFESNLTDVEWACLIPMYSPATSQIPESGPLNSFRTGSEAFAPREAMRVRKRFEFRYTPKHGSWLNMAEIEIGALSRQCLRRRIPDRATMLRETAAWVKRRNAAGGTVDWRFTTADARVKLKSLYPAIQ